MPSAMATATSRRRAIEPGSFRSCARPTAAERSSPLRFSPARRLPAGETVQSLSARAGNRHFGSPSALRPHTNAPYNCSLRWNMLRVVDRPGRARTSVERLAAVREPPRLPDQLLVPTRRLEFLAPPSQRRLAFAMQVLDNWCRYLQTHCGRGWRRHSPAATDSHPYGVMGPYGYPLSSLL